ncbi:hypothetical protein N0V90_005600 [Kalmusia sp. IMI 367209]|nr:hypothetical protein N0V90_005600 [Kalmusia sp. IMI 367209]
MFKATSVRAMQPSRMLFMRQTAPLYMRQTARMMKPVPRLRQLKKIPAELIPLGVVLAVAVGAAIFSLGRKLMVDKTLRLKRQAGN